MNSINSSSIANVNNTNDIQSANKEDNQKFNKTLEPLSSPYNPSGLEAKANQNNFSSSFLKATLQASFTQPSDLKARSKISGADSDSPERSPISKIKTEANSKSEYDISKIPGLKNNPNVTPEFLAKVDSIAKELDTEPATLLAIISFETGGEFSPSTPNPSTNATGLIQFIPSTARSLLTKTLKDPTTNLTDKKQLIDNLPLDKQAKSELKELATNANELPTKKKQIDAEINNLNKTGKDLMNQLRDARKKNLPKETQNDLASQLKDVLNQRSTLKKEQEQVKKQINSLPEAIDSKITKETATKAFKQMSSTQQLDYVKEYLLAYKGKLNTPQDAYLAVLFPQAVGKGSSPNAVVFSQGSEYYEKNQGLDGIINGKKDGVVTVEEATKKVTDFLRNARR